jgi:hypothetical protein
MGAVVRRFACGEGGSDTGGHWVLGLPAILGEDVLISAQLGHTIPYGTGPACRTR